MEEAGAKVELVYTRKLKINPCLGEFYCWFKTPGECFQKDEMALLLPKLNASDIWVFGVPVYGDGVPGPVKNLMDRMLPMVQPYFELPEDHCRHPRREGNQKDNFDPMLAHMKAFCRNAGTEFAGALLRPHGEELRAMLKMGEAVQDIFDAAREAGRQLVRDGKMATETLDIVSRELLPRESYVQHANRAFMRALEALDSEGAGP
jgi:multimeric flavodoxin WrbA